MPILRRCTTCQEMKGLYEYYQSKTGKYGKAAKCKECQKQHARERRITHGDHVRRLRRIVERGALERRRIASNKYDRQNREKAIAHTKVQRAIKKGILVRGPCSSCGSTKNIHGHHEDYNKPLEVIWLCSIHHKQLHAAKERSPCPF